LIEPVLSDDAFLADLESAPRDPDRMDIWWVGQSGFVIQNGTRICIDPYLSDSLTEKYENTDKPHIRISRRVVDPSRLPNVSMLIATHAHTDHLDPITINAIHGQYWNQWMLVLYPREVEPVVRERFAKPPHSTIVMVPGATQSLCGVQITAVPASHGSVPALGYVIRGIRGLCTVYHSGDTVIFPGMADHLRPFNIDIAILPVNGKLGNMNGIEAARLANDIGAKVVIPCHYDMFEFNTADPYEQFVPECERIGQRYRVLKLGERFTWPQET